MTDLSVIHFQILLDTMAARRLSFTYFFRTNEIRKILSSDHHCSIQFSYNARALAIVKPANRVHSKSVI